MYRFTRTAVALPGQGPASMEFAGRIASHITLNHGVEVSFGLEIGGQVGRVYWYSDHESLAAFEELNAGLMQDEAVSAMVSDAAGDLFIAGETYDTLVQIF
jgi:hypothetical protein